MQLQRPERTVAFRPFLFKNELTFTSGRWLIAFLLWQATTCAQNPDCVATYMGEPVEIIYFFRFLRGSPLWGLDFVTIYEGLPCGS